MIMGTHSTTLVRPHRSRNLGPVAALAAALALRCIAFLARRIERAASAGLGSMSDRQLRDLGVARDDQAPPTGRSRQLACTMWPTGICA
jgi:uncharacterized protein YjiS (DUF1127 family)